MRDARVCDVNAESGAECYKRENLGNIRMRERHLVRVCTV